MDSIEQVLGEWESVGILLLLMLTAVALFYYGSRVWRDQHVSVNVFLGTTLALVGAALYFFGRHWHLNISHRTFFFILLYLWCASWMFFFGGRARPFKMVIALLLQAGIIYALYKYT